MSSRSIHRCLMITLAILSQVTTVNGQILPIGEGSIDEARPSLSQARVITGNVSNKTYLTGSSHGYGFMGEGTDPIVFIHVGQGSGTLDGVPFGVDSPASFVITARGRLEDRVANFMNSGGVWVIEHIAASIHIAGVGTAEFITETRTFVNNGLQLVGFSRGGPSGLDLFNGPNHPDFATWDMSNSIGPIAGTASLLQWDSSSVMTNRGVLSFDDSTGPAIFTAVTSEFVFLHEGQGSGTLDGVPFGVDSPADFVIAATGNLADRMDFGSGWSIDHTSASITITGVGTTRFITETVTFVNNETRTVGFSRSYADLFNGPEDSAFQTWEMNHEIGPVSGEGSLLQWDSEDILTTEGVLFFEDGSGPATFSALHDAIFADGFESGDTSAWTNTNL